MSTQGLNIGNGKHLVSENGAILAQSIRQGRAIAVTDGLYEENHETVASIIKGTDLKYWLVVVNIALGRPVDQSSLCSELVG